ncbi:hypothetical protein KTE49_30405, partial [Burkholderia multivorans]|nr:hypothetical protein [Burkholderia multivorans]
PDWSQARIVPKRFAELCAETFRLCVRQPFPESVAASADERAALAKLRAEMFDWLASCTKEHIDGKIEFINRVTEGFAAIYARSAASPAAEVAQWQSRLKDRSSPVVDHWVNISPDGAKTLMEKYSDVYEVRALYTAPRSPAVAAEAVADERAAFEKVFPMPADCQRIGSGPTAGYAPTEYGAWEARAFIRRWEGWKARAAVSPAGSIPAGWKLVPIEPTESMVVNGFESWPDEFFSDPEVWDAFEKMTGCQQAAHKAQLCYAAMLASAPQPPAQADAREGLTDEQREAIEYAITRMDLNVSNRDAYTAAKELRALLNGAGQ